MKLTDEKILELASESGVVYRARHAGCMHPYVDGTDLTVFVLDFARAIEALVLQEGVPHEAD